MEVPAVKSGRLDDPAFCLASPPRLAHSLKDVARAVLVDHANVDPSFAFNERLPSHVPDVSAAIRAMLFAVVLDRHHDVFPTHVEKGARNTAIEHRNLCLWPRITGIDE